MQTCKKKSHICQNSLHKLFLLNPGLQAAPGLEAKTNFLIGLQQGLPAHIKTADTKFSLILEHHDPIFTPQLPAGPCQFPSIVFDHFPQACLNSPTLFPECYVAVFHSCFLCPVLPYQPSFTSCFKSQLCHFPAMQFKLVTVFQTVFSSLKWVGTAQLVWLSG